LFPLSALRPTSRIPSLDGLRAIAIGLVLIGHVAGTQNCFKGDFIRESVGDTGHFGVRVFFVISGFLITTLLLNELRENGEISLRRFYLRRSFRIFPAFYFFLLATALIVWSGAIAIPSRDFVRAATYTMNYHYEREWWLGHIWSLSVEEQFYLLWPAVLAVCGFRWGIRVAAATVVVAPFVRTAVHVFLPEWRVGLGESFETICDAIAVGCVLASVRDQLGRSTVYASLMSSRWFILVPTAAILASRFHPYSRFGLPIGETVMNVALALCVDWSIRNAHTSVGRLLNSQPLVAVGVMSYSIYLWQQIFLNRNSVLPMNAFPLNLVLVFIAAAASFFLIERPFLGLRRKIEAAWLPSEQPPQLREIAATVNS
jgi:peptidoglycan/LPS O-acetylase OafA/YrhL